MKTRKALSKADVSLKTLEEYMKLDYEIIIRALSEDEGGGWFAYYKDFKGVMGDGENPKEAMDDVTKAFRAFIENSLSSGDVIPLPSSHQPKAVRLNITIPEDELETMDRFAKSHGMSRSGLIQAATRQYIRAS